MHFRPHGLQAVKFQSDIPFMETMLLGHFIHELRKSFVFAEEDTMDRGFVDFPFRIPVG